MRDYGTARWEGGDAGCDHRTGRFERGGLSDKQASNNGSAGDEARGDCSKCGAHRIDSQIGLEATPEAYIATMVGVFREVWRVLKDDGTVWLNLGSSFAGSGKGRNGDGSLGKINSAKQRSNVGAGFPYVSPCGISDRGRSDSRPSDWSSHHLCDGCRAVLSDDHTVHNDHLPDSTQGPSSFESSHEHMESAPDHLPTSDSMPQADRSLDATGGLRTSPDLSGGPLLVSQVSTIAQSSARSQDECYHCANCDVCLNVLGSASRDSRLCARKKAYHDERRLASRAIRHRKNNGDKLLTDDALRRHNADKLFASEAWRYLTTTSVKAKDDTAIPWLLVLALRADGWYLRAPIIWAKRNPMPESVTDRPTRSHEYIFLLSKRSAYYYDADAIREDESVGWNGSQFTTGKTALNGDRPHLGMGPRNQSVHMQGTPRNDGERWRLHEGGVASRGSRNKRDVWTVNSEPTPEAHFATFPQKLIEPCILAGTSEKGECVKCGKNWVRVTEQVSRTRTRLRNGLGQDCDDGTKGRAGEVSSVTTGWRPQCDCDAPTRPNIVLDPFLGSGTVGKVCEHFGRRWVGLELSAEYIGIAQRRTAQIGLFQFGAAK